MNLRIKKITKINNNYSSIEWIIQKEINIFGIFKFWTNIWSSVTEKLYLQNFSKKFTEEEVQEIARSFLDPIVKIKYIDVK